jgi:hypothetical protein
LALVVLFVARDAAAFSAVAGMCDPVGASAPAPFPAMPVRGGEITAADDCDFLMSDFGSSSSGGEEASLELPEPGPKPAPAGLFQILKRIGERAAVPKAPAAPASSAHLVGIYRPPRG